MIQVRQWLSGASVSLVVSVLGILGSMTSAYGVSLNNTLIIPGESIDLYSSATNNANTNRLGGFFSDLYYDRDNNLYYGLADRGPGGGTISYDTRVQKFSLDIDPNTGAIANFTLLETIAFTQNGENFNGLNPTVLNGNPGVLGLSLDPEGFAVAPNGNFYVSDEYGPSVYEFAPNGSFIRAFETPSNLIPRTASGPDYVAGRPTITSGRQDNRGFEGVTLSPDGSSLFAILQDPLVNEGSSNDGRRSTNVRIVEFNTATGESVAQYIYPLESITQLNNNIPGTANDFSATQQGRNIGVSGIVALNNNELLVLERDNRGLGVGDTTGVQPPVASKQVYKINLTGATDVTNISLAGTNTLPAGVIPVSKSPFLNIATALQAAGQPIPEKIEGLAIGPQLADGSYALLLGTDNDFSVTQNDTNTQFDVCTNGTQVALDAGCPVGSTLIPTYLYSFRASGTELAGFVPSQKVPEPTATVGLMLLAVGGFWRHRRQG